MAKELLSWTCPQCGKVITSLYSRQLEQNKKAHLDKHQIDVPKETSELKK